VIRDNSIMQRLMALLHHLSSFALYLFLSEVSRDAIKNDRPLFHGRSSLDKSRTVSFLMHR